MRTMRCGCAGCHKQKEGIVSIQSKKVQLSFPLFKLKKLRQYGKDHEMENGHGNLKDGTVSMKAIDLVLSLYSDAEIQAYLQTNGCTFHELIRRSCKQYISSEKRQ